MLKLIYGTDATKLSQDVGKWVSTIPVEGANWNEYDCKQVLHKVGFTQALYNNQYIAKNDLRNYVNT